MAISVTLTVTPTAPTSGETVTAVYTVTGNDAVAPLPVTVDGVATVGGIEYTVNASFTLPGTPALPESFDVPTVSGLTFEATSDPATFTAIVP